MALPLPDGAPIYTRGAYVVSDSNAAAWRAAEAWARSGAPAFIICGPAGSGKTHLASILAQDLGGQFCDLAATEAPPPGDGAIVFDNLPGNAPHKLFAFIEDLAARRRRLVLAGAGRPGEWSGGLKDLRTRLEAMPRANLGEPDETLIRCVIAKGFRDRQVAVAPEVVNFVALRLQRKFAAARAFVVAADRAALEEKRKISIAFAQEIIDNLLQREPGVGGEDTAQPRSDEGGAVAVSR
jgi:chromosomal replication initiation ATPase DnaA